MAAPSAPSRASQSDQRDIYAGLPLINNQRLKLDTSSPFTPTYVKRNLTASSDPSQTYASRVQGRQILLENPARESRAKKVRAQKRAARATAPAAAHPIATATGGPSDTGRRRRGAWKLEGRRQSADWLGCPGRAARVFNADVPLCPSARSPRPWPRHAAAAAAMPGAAGMHAKLVKADFHGSFVIVRRSKNPCLVGLSGIVLFLRVFPWPATTILDMPHIEFELYGNHFCYRAAERAGKKFKHKETIEL
ncbi:RNase P/MRP, p29 subunit [Epithele typhae]|uniref:RNase P/MRP, p29 subunit n=1 Tax=Epithele typhae TaxID=378194 RepID=UPI0020088BF4|nr:RNase P/MRP, p29 subunit [Epithele typhae]KAH9946195.1 RNase P/MRP, p29 subunit [Epithele typhae]